MEKRRFPRMHNSNFQVDVSDGERFFSGSVHDLSRYGLCLENIPKKINHNAKKLSIVMSCNGNNFKILARARWSEEERLSKMIGMEIVKIPWGWAEFVMSQEQNSTEPFGRAKI